MCNTPPPPPPVPPPAPLARRCPRRRHFNLASADPTSSGPTHPSRFSRVNSRESHASPAPNSRRTFRGQISNLPTTDSTLVPERRLAVHLVTEIRGPPLLSPPGGYRRAHRDEYYVRIHSVPERPRFSSRRSRASSRKHAVGFDRATSTATRLVARCQFSRRVSSSPRIPRTAERLF